MNKEIYAFALRNTLNEIRKVCPDIMSSFIVSEDGEVLVSDEKVSETNVIKTHKTLAELLEKTGVIGGLERVTINGSEGKVNLAHIEDAYLVMISTKTANMTNVNLITQVSFSTVFKLLEKLPQNSHVVDQREIKPGNQLIEPQQKPGNQLIIETIGGLFVPSDTVRIDNEVLSEWEKLLEGKKIEKVEIEVVDGETAQFKVKPIKQSEYGRKDVIQIPKKVQETFDIKKGQLVRATPLVE